MLIKCWLQTNHSDWFSSEDNSCNDIMLLILSFAVHSEMGCGLPVCFLSNVTNDLEFEAAQLPVWEMMVGCLNSMSSFSFQSVS